LRRIRADGAFRSRLVRWARRAAIWVPESLTSAGWLDLSRRPSRDYEVLPASSEAFIRLAMMEERRPEVEVVAGFNAEADRQPLDEFDGRAGGT